MNCIDPMALKQLLWPQYTFYDKQVAVVYSVEDTPETFVPAGNKLGKDFITGFIVVCKFLRALKMGRTCRILTTSATDEHLDVLWAEINHFIATATVPLLYGKGGPLVVTHHRIRLGTENDSDNLANLKSYVTGKVAKTSSQGEGLAGHHAEETLAVGDEVSAVPEVAYKMFQGWAKRMLFIGNCNPCNNFFYKAVKAGDLLAA